MSPGAVKFYQGLSTDMQRDLNNSDAIQRISPVAGAGAWGHGVEVGGTEAWKIQWLVKAREPKQTRIPKTQLAGAGKAARWPGLQCALQYPGLF